MGRKKENREKALAGLAVFFDWFDEKCEEAQSAYERAEKLLGSSLWLEGAVKRLDGIEERERGIQINLRRLDRMLSIAQTAFNTKMVTRVQDLGLPLKTVRCLLAGNIHTTDQLISKSRNDLLRLPNIGKKALEDIESALRNMGLELNG